MTLGGEMTRHFSAHYRSALLFTFFSGVSCLAEDRDQATAGNGEETAAAMAEYGIDTGVVYRAECDCNDEEANSACDYVYIPGSECQCQSPQAGYATCGSYQGAWLADGAWMNASISYRAFLSCPISEIYRYFEGYGADDIGQVAYYSRTRNSTYPSWGQLRSASTYGVSWQSRGTCTNNTVGDSIVWCNIDNPSISSTQPLVNLNVLLSRNDQAQAQPIFQGIRVCFDTDN